MSTRKNDDERQMEFILPELCFPGRAVVLSGEIARRLEVDPKHIVDHINEPNSKLIAINTGRTSRGNYRIPVTSYYAWLASLLTGTPAENPILQLSTPILIKLFTGIAARLAIRGEHPELLILKK